MLQVVVRELCAMKLQFQNQFQVIGEYYQKRCFSFLLINDIINQAGRQTSFSQTSNFSQSQIDAFRQTFDIILGKTRQLQDKALICHKCSLVTNGLPIKSLTESIIQKRDANYRGHNSNWDWLNFRHHIYEKWSSIAESMHVSKVCRFQQATIQSIKYTERSPIINKILPKKIARQQLLEGLNQIQFDDDGFQQKLTLRHDELQDILKKEKIQESFKLQEYQGQEEGVLKQEKMQE